MGYSPWDCKESETTERLSTAQHSMTIKKKDHSCTQHLLLAEEPWAYPGDPRT